MPRRPGVSLAPMQFVEMFVANNVMLKSIEVHRSWDGALVSHEKWAPDCIFAFIPLCLDLGSTNWSRWPSSNSVSNTSPRK